MTTADIEEVIQDFDFEKVHRVMEFVGWTWCDKGVPSVDQLKDKVRSLWANVLQSGGGECRTCGFSVYCYPAEGEENGEMGIRFWLERAFKEI